METRGQKNNISPYPEKNNNNLKSGLQLRVKALRMSMIGLAVCGSCFGVSMNLENMKNQLRTNNLPIDAVIDQKKFWN
jgi:hypothetical protein